MTFEQFERIGYSLHRNVRDCMGVMHRFCISPANGTTGGGVNYFETMRDIDIWYYQVLETRAVTSGNTEIAARYRTIVYSKKNNIPIHKLLNWWE